MFPSLNEVTGSQLEDIGLVQTLPIGREVDLFKGCILSESCLVKEVLASPVLAFFPFCMYQSGKYFVGTGRFQGAACQSCLVGMSHAVESHLGE
jgi:hypothetical protein